eukprot:jgi/Galph1/3125/GphlegSOOS_G1776.1
MLEIRITASSSIVVPSREYSHFVNLTSVDSAFKGLQVLSPNYLILDLHSASWTTSEINTIYFENLATASNNLGNCHILLINSIGTGNSVCTVPAEIAPVIKQQLANQNRIEGFLKEIDANVTVVRAGPFHNSVKTGNAIVTESPYGYGSISKPDLVEMVLKILLSSHAKNKTLTCVDSQRIFQMTPYIRPLEFWEPLPFEKFEL